jgi:hypothetical protein
MPLATFADRFRPIAARTQDFGGPLAGAMAGLVAGGSSMFSTSEMNRSEVQVRHYRLWSYIAVLRNSMTAARDMPQVGVLTRGESARVMSMSRSPVDQRQQSFLRQFYQGVLQSQLSDNENLSPVVDGHPLKLLLQNVNESDWWVSFAFETFMFWQLTGCFYWWVLDNGFGVPGEMWVIPPQWMTAEYSRSGELIKWVVRSSNGKKLDLPPEEVIYTATKNPRDKVMPLSPLDAGSEWVLNGESVEQVRQQLLNQGIWPSLLVHMGDEWDDPSEELIRAVGDKFMSRVGGAGRAGQPLIIPPHMQAQPWTLKQNELGLQADSEQLRDNTLALYGTPRAIAGLAHDLNRANIDGAHLIYSQHTIMPLQIWLSGVLTWKLAVPRFDARLRVWFNDCRPNDADLELRETELDFKYGALTPDERRSARGRSPLGTPASGKTFLLNSLTPLEDFDSGPESRLQNSSQSQPDSSSSAANPSKKKSSENRSSGFEIQLTRTRRYVRIAREFRRLHSQFEGVAMRSLSRFWKSVKRHALAVFDSDPAPASTPSPSELVPPGDFRGQFNKALTPLWESAAKAGVSFEQQLLGLGGSQSLRPVLQADEYPNIEMELPEHMKRRIREFLAERQDGVWSHVMSTTHAALEAAISDGINAGLGMKDIRRRVEEALDGRAADSMMIARTETTASLNAGQQALRDAEKIDQKIWLATIDARTRPTHAAADSQVVENRAPFVVGGYKMQHPGDGSLGAPASEIVACRCCATGYVE